MAEDLTPSQRRALCILGDSPGLTPGGFARLMWPDSPSWNSSGDSARRVGMHRSGGAYLGKLSRAGLVTHLPDHTYRLTKTGMVLLWREA